MQELIAYQVSDLPLRLEVASASRQWMEETPKRYAKRCLPLLLANYGWHIVTTVPFRVMWDGTPGISAIRIESMQAGVAAPCISHFGSGILTFPLNWLFRTPPGYNLLLRGPANFPKDGAYALEGLVETDHAVATATMNWKMTRPGLPVTFEVGFPICMLVPQKRGELETFVPQVRHISETPEIQCAYNEWSASRATFNAELGRPDSEATKRGWQKDYFRASHQTKLSLKEFGPVPLQSPHTGQ